MSLPRQTPISEIIRKLKALGWDGPYRKRDQRRGGSDHPFMRKGSQTVKIPNPHGQPIGRDLLKNILYQARIAVDEWVNA